MKFIIEWNKHKNFFLPTKCKIHLCSIFCPWTPSYTKINIGDTQTAIRRSNFIILDLLCYYCFSRSYCTIGTKLFIYSNYLLSAKSDKANFHKLITSYIFIVKMAHKHCSMDIFIKIDLSLGLRFRMKATPYEPLSIIQNYYFL